MSHSCAVPADPSAHHEVSRRRTFAIISHPDAGKTTLTEKLLLYGGAIHLAGSVKARRAERAVRSDWMAIERERGISVTASVLQFEHDGCRINLLDTPGHADFSEDTYRALAVADSAVMLLDNRRGVEARTRQLFTVCRRSGTPIATFVNKCDRAGVAPLQLLDEVERELGVACAPVTWPVYRDGRLVGIAHRESRQMTLYDRTDDHGASRATADVLTLDDPALEARLGFVELGHVREELALLDAVTPHVSHRSFLDGTVSPTFFGSALTNVGVESFFHGFLALAPPPGAVDMHGRVVDPVTTPFSAVVFKIQANMDPRHRDRVAFLRVRSGRLEPGMSVQNARTGQAVRLQAPRQFLARERQMVDGAWAGDVVGVYDRGDFRVGDTLSADGSVIYAGIPRFAPEHFAVVTAPDPLRRKHLDAGLKQLAEEGLVQLLREDPRAPEGPRPVVAAVGPLQFDLLLHRLEHEYGAVARLERMRYTHARWLDGPDDAVRRLARSSGRLLLYDRHGRPVLLFESEWSVRSAPDAEPTVTLLEVEP
jgi:peptide chain release factor 3